MNLHLAAHIVAWLIIGAMTICITFGIKVIVQEWRRRNYIGKK